MFKKKKRKKIYMNYLVISYFNGLYKTVNAEKPEAPSVL